MPPKRRVASAKTESSTSSASSSAPSSASTKETCCVCCQTIHMGKHEALFCSGTCQQWLHRYCANVSVQCYKTIKDEDHPFFCFWCCQARSQHKIAELTSTVEQLTLENMRLKQSLSEAQSQVSAPQADNPTQQSYADVTCSAVQVVPPDSGIKLQKIQSTTSSQISHSERKFNVIVYGIEECPKGTPKHARLQSDLSHVGSVLSEVDTSVDSQSIKDCYCLGKFIPNQSLPRPVLVKFIQISDASSILSKKGKLSRPFSIKPDLSPEERRRDSLLLKERWQLIQSGKDRNDIKIRGSRLYVNKRLYGCIVDSQLQYTSVPSSSTTLPKSVVPSDRSSLSPTSNDTSTIVPSNSTPYAELPTSVPPTASNASSPTPCNISNSTVHPPSPCNPSTPTVQPPISNAD